MRTPLLLLLSAFSLVHCGGGETPSDARNDVAQRETNAAEDVIEDTAMAPDSTAMLDASEVSIVLDASNDTVEATVPDTAPIAEDVLADTATVTDVVADTASPPLPAMCMNNMECGTNATCDTMLQRCVCTGTSLPCASGCCASTFTRDVMLPAGHSPELAWDSMGRTYVLFKRGSNNVLLATIETNGTVAMQPVAQSSGQDDDADFAVAPDGTVYVAVHQAGSGRSGLFNLFTRAPGATNFTMMSLRAGAPDAFAYNAAVSIARAPNGDIYAAVSARTGDGTMGLAMTAFQTMHGVWTGLPTILTYHGHSRSELFATNTGFFVGVHDLGYAERYARFDANAMLLENIATTAGTIYGRGESAAALRENGVFYTFTSGTLASTDRMINDRLTFAGLAGGSRSDIDMALDRDGNPALLFHSVTTHQLGLKVRMPRGGYTTATWPESIFVPFPMTTDWLSLDFERHPSGNLAFVVGDSMDRVPMRYREIARGL